MGNVQNPSEKELNEAELREKEKQEYMFIIVLNGKMYDSFRIERALTDADALVFYKQLLVAFPDAKTIDAIAFPPKRGHMMSEIWRKIGKI